MSVESRRVTKTEVWVGWENQVINGVYPLRRFLGGSNHSAVFLTEYRAEGLPNAAIKLVPADTLESQAQLVQWGTAATLSYPHLIRLFDVGRCQLGGRGFLFVVMEYAEQTLAQILPKRALSPDEVLEMLLPTLSALAFLHRQNLVQGQLKPSNVLVVNDQLKLASDTIRSTGQLTSGVVRASMYDPPELKDGEISAAGDVWGLGITLIEALTQHPPAWPDERSGTVSLATGLPPPFVDTVQRCLNPTPSSRPTAIELDAQYNPVARAHPITVSAEPEPVYEPPSEATPPPPPPSARRSSKRPMLVLAIAASLVLSLAFWVSRPVFHEHPNSRPTAPGISQGQVERPAAPGIPAVEASDAADAVDTTDNASHVPVDAAAADAVDTADGASHVPADAAPAVSSSAATIVRPAGDPAELPARTSAIATTSEAQKSQEPQTSQGLPETNERNPEGSSAAPTVSNQPPPRSGGAPGSVLHEEKPDVAQIIRGKIRGHIKVTVRVLVDPAGNVVGEFFENPGPSRYFARLAGDAAGEWKFTPTDARGSRVWLLRFEFTSNGATVQADGAR